MDTGVLEPARRGVAEMLVHVAAVQHRWKTTERRLSEHTIIISFLHYLVLLIFYSSIYAVGKQKHDLE